MPVLATMSRKKQVAFAVVAACAAMILLEVAARVVLKIWPNAGYSDPADDPPLPVANLGNDNYVMERRFRALREAEGLTIDLAPDESRGWSLAPGAFVMRTAISSGVALARINSLGFRGPELAARQANEIRIMGLGDSTLFGFGVRESAGAIPVAARILANSLTRPVNPVVAATPGYDSGQCLETLRQHGRVVQPDVVVIAALWSDLSPRRFDPTNGQPAPQATSALVGTLLKPVKELATYRLMLRYLEPILGSQKVGFIGEWGEVGANVSHPPRTSADNFRRNLKAMDAAAQELGARTLFMVLPAPIDFATDPLPDRVAVFRSIIAEVADETGALLLDGPEIFRTHGGRISYFLDQVHPAAEGHQLLGQALAELLTGPLSRL